MDKDKAVRLAFEALKADGYAVGTEALSARREDRIRHSGKHRSGWIVTFPLDVPPRFEPDRVFVEVVDPDGEVHIPDVL